MPNQKPNLLPTLTSSGIGSKLGQAACEDMYREGELRTWNKGAMIFQEGEDAAGIYIVVEGLVKLTRYTYDGREVILHFAEPCMIIAEAAIFLGHYPATAIALENSSLIFIHRELLFDLMNRHRAILHQVFDSMAIWLKRLVGRIDQLTLNDAAARLINYLLQLLPAKTAGTDVIRPATLTLPVKKGELAVMLNMNQASLSRVLRTLQDENLLEVSGRNVILHDIRKLRQKAMPDLEGGIL